LYIAGVLLDTRSEGKGALLLLLRYDAAVGIDENPVAQTILAGAT